MKKRTVELNEKELYLLWSIATWFSGIVSSSLMYKLYPGDDLRKKYDARYKSEIEDTLIDKGVWLKAYRKQTTNSAGSE